MTNKHSTYKNDLMLEAAIALKRLTNKLDGECHLCVGTTEIDGRGHKKDCLIYRLLTAAVLSEPTGIGDKLWHKACLLCTWAY